MELAKILMLGLIIATTVPQVVTTAESSGECSVSIHDARGLVTDEQFPLLQAGWNSVFGDSVECSELMGKALLFIGQSGGQE